MKTGFRARRLNWLIIFMLIFMTSQLFGKRLKIKVLNTNKEIVKANNTINMRTHEILAIQFTGSWQNNTANTEYWGSMVKYWQEDLPSYIERWEDKSVQVLPGETETLQNVSTHT